MQFFSENKQETCYTLTYKHTMTTDLDLHNYLEYELISYFSNDSFEIFYNSWTRLVGPFLGFWYRSGF